MNILVTGGAGYIGNVLTRILLASHEVKQVTVIDNFFFNQASSIISLLDNKKFNLINSDVRNNSVLKKTIKRCDLIIPLAAIVGAPACDKNRKLATEINYNQIKFISETKSNQQLLILPVTNSGYGIGGEKKCDENSPLEPVSHYGKTKVLAEKIILEKKNFISLRLATVFGISSRMRTDLLVNDFVFKAFKDNYLELFESHFRRNFIHIKDVAKVILFLLKNFKKFKDNIYNVGLDNANLTKMQLAMKIRKRIKNLKIVKNEVSKDPDKRDYLVSNRKILNTGWKPEHSLDEGIDELIKFYPFFKGNNSTNI